MLVHCRHLATQSLNYKYKRNKVYRYNTLEHTGAQYLPTSIWALGIFWSPVYVWINKKIQKSQFNIPGTSNFALEEEVKHQNVRLMINTE